MRSLIAIIAVIALCFSIADAEQFGLVTVSHIGVNLDYAPTGYSEEDCFDTTVPYEVYKPGTVESIWRLFGPSSNQMGGNIFPALLQVQRQINNGPLITLGSQALPIMGGWEVRHQTVPTATLQRNDIVRLRIGGLVNTSAGTCGFQTDFVDTTVRLGTPEDECQGP